MATDPPSAAHHPAPRPDDPASGLVAQVHNYSRVVIEAELRRLARRAPSLRPEDLDIIDAALDEIAESLLLARLRRPWDFALDKRIAPTTERLGVRALAGEVRPHHRCNQQLPDNAMTLLTCPPGP